MLTFLLALFLGFGKRKEDIILVEERNLKVREGISNYQKDFIQGIMFIFASVIIVSYLMYTLSEDTMVRFHSHNLYMSTYFVIIGLIRYIQIILLTKDETTDPTRIVLKDKFIQITLLGWIVFLSILLYF